MAEIRGFAPGDLDALYAISQATGLAGGDASHLYADAKMMGHIYAAPYAVLTPGLVLVVADRDGVAGFAAGAVDTHAWEGRLEREWWPALRTKYPDPAGIPEAEMTHDQRRAAMIHRPAATPAPVRAAFPAHLHLNLLPRLQRQGLGTRMFDAWRTLAASQGAGPMHVAVNRANEWAVRFWGKRGFVALAPDGVPAGRTLWMGRN